MNHYSTNALPSRYADLVVHAGPSPLGAWFGAALRRLTRSDAQPAVPRDLAREAAEVRNWADVFRNTDPGFAADLYAAADRHESMAN